MSETVTATVRTLTGEMFSVNINFNDSTAQIMSSIRKSTGLSCIKNVLLDGGMVLSDSNKLSDMTSPDEEITLIIFQN